MFKAIHKMKKGEERGFTLIELLIVIAIIAILAVIAIPQFAAYRARAIRASMQADARNIATLEEALFSDTQSYAANTGTAPDVTLTVGAVTHSGRLSQNNTVNITGTPAAYTIAVTNAAAGANSTRFSMTNTGQSGFY